MALPMGSEISASEAAGVGALIGVGVFFTTYVANAAIVRRGKPWTS